MISARPILFDVRRLIWRVWAGGMPTGVDHVCLAYLKHYGPHAQAVVEQGRVCRILSPAQSDELFSLLRFDNDRFKRQISLLGLKAALRTAGESQKGSGRLYLNVGHTGLDRTSRVAALNARPIYLLHDLIPITHPEYCRAGEDIRHVMRVRNILHRGKGVIANSDDTVAALQTFATREGLEAPKTITALLGTRIMNKLHDRSSPLAKPYFVMLGTIEGRKNHILILNIWRELVRTLGDNAPKLVIIGRRGWESEQAVDLLERCELLKDHVVELSHCPDDQVARYFQNARALLFPSFVEGYGMPLLEALAIGLPVIASDLDVFKELAGDIPDYLSPIDGIGWQAKILEYLPDDSQARAAQIARMAGFRPPDWAEHFSKVDRWLETIE